MAPRPVRQKCWPDRRALRHGVQLGAGTNARRNRTPSRATRSKLGVRTASLIVPGPSSWAYAPAYRPQSSANAKRMFGRFASAAHSEAGPDRQTPNHRHKDRFMSGRSPDGGGMIQAPRAGAGIGLPGFRVAAPFYPGISHGVVYPDGEAASLLGHRLPARCAVGGALHLQGLPAVREGPSPSTAIVSTPPLNGSNFARNRGLRGGPCWLRRMNVPAARQPGVLPLFLLPAHSLGCSQLSPPVGTGRITYREPTTLSRLSFSGPTLTMTAIGVPSFVVSTAPSLLPASSLGRRKSSSGLPRTSAEARPREDGGDRGEQDVPLRRIRELRDEGLRAPGSPPEIRETAGR